MRHITARSTTLISALAAAALLAGCDAGTDSSGTGRLSLDITDAPVDSAAEVVVRFTGVSLKPENGRAITVSFDEPYDIDLLALQGGKTEALLEEYTLAAGRYEWVRLLVDADRYTSTSYILLDDGARHPLFIPSGSQTGLKLVGGFTVPVGGEAAYTIDFDLRKSVIAPPGQGDDYLLKPTLRMVDNAEVGAITGTVAMESLTHESCGPNVDENANVVYVYQGADVTPVDISGGDDDPLSTARVKPDADGHYVYKAAFLPAGEYTVAFTCQGALDDPEERDELVFIGAGNVLVEAGKTAQYDF